MANVTTPRYGDANHFAIREGKIQNVYCALFKEKQGADGSYETWSADEACNCAIPGVGSFYMCHQDYAFFKDPAPLDRFQCVVVVQESATNNITWTSSSYFDIEASENVGQHYDKLTKGVTACQPQSDCAGVSLGNQNLPTLNVIYLRGTGSWAYTKHRLTYLGDQDTIPKSWFRTLWNSIMVDDTISLTTAAACEPGNNVYHVYHISFSELGSSLNYTDTGWSIGNRCPYPWDATKCGTITNTGDLPFIQLATYQDIRGPTLTYPFYLYHNGGAAIDQYPGGIGGIISYYDANSYP
jgi:hypothetical protein